MRKALVLFIVLALLGTAVLGLDGCRSTTSSDSTRSSSQTKGPIVVGSKIDTEGSLLAQIIIAMLRADGFTVVDKSQFGTTQIVRQALLSGELDIYPEYTGNGAFFFPNSDQTVWADAQKGYDTVKKLDKDTNNVIWLQPAPANNTWAIAVTKALSDSQNLRSMSDLAAYVNKGGNIKLAASDEFVTSPVALPAFQKAYGFVLRNDQLVTFSSGNTALTEQAAATGINGVNAAMAYGTDGSLSTLGLVVLSDPKGAQPVYEPAPTLRGVTNARFPGISKVLDPVFQSLTLETLQSLNARIAIQGQNPASVATDYLTQKGFLKK